MKESSTTIVSVLIACIVMYSQLCFAQDKSFNEGYKNAKWGMSKEQVKRNFSDMIFRDEGKAIGFLSKDRKSTRLNSSHSAKSRMPSSA